MRPRGMCEAGSGWRTPLLCLLLLVSLAGIPARAGAPSSMGSAAVEDAWGPVTIATDAPVRLVALDDTANGLPLRPTFQLSRTDGGSVIQAAETLASDPPVRLDVTGEADGILTLRPRAPLVHGTTYRFSAADPDGRRLGSWRFTTVAPLGVEGSVPEDEAGRVPASTGIEVTFNQPGWADPGPWWSIDPAVDGRFERHGRTLVFVPAAPLRPATAYTVRLRAGMPVPVTGEVLPDGWTLRFTTAASDGGRVVEAWGDFPRRVVETSTQERAVLAYDVFKGGVRSLWVQVHRLPDATAAAAAIRSLVGEETAGAEHPVDTAGLPRELAATLRLRVPDRDFWTRRSFTLPAVLPAGWYVVTVRDGSRSRDQAIVQVTDLAAYAELTWTRSVVWVHDLATGEPAAGATVRLADGIAMGRTDDDGLLVADTPDAALEADAWPILLVADGARSLLVPFGAGGWESGDDFWPDRAAEGGRDQYWTILSTDRTMVRSTDTLDAWGMVRDRDTGEVPATATLQLTSWATDEGVPIWSAPVTPTRSGTFVAQIPLVDLPEGGYELQLRVGEVPADQAWIEVATIAKPSYRITLTPGHRVFIAGESIPLQATAAFFDGTAAPGVPILITTDEEDQQVRGITDLRGRVDGELAAPRSPWEQWSYVGITASPARGEEGETSDWTDVVVFRSSVIIDGHATIEDGTGRLTATLTALDRERMEREFDHAWEWGVPVMGDPVAGGQITVKVVEETWFKHQSGTTYDYLTKQAQPTYDYTERDRVLLTRTVPTGARGRATLEFPAPRGHDYRVVLSATDAAGRRTSTELYAEGSSVPDPWDEGFSLAASWPGGGERVPIGATATVTMMDDGRPLAGRDGGRSLWLTAQRGLRTATVTRSPVFHVAMDPGSVPTLVITGVRFTGSGYATPRSPAYLDVDPGLRRLTVTVNPGQPRYSPGDVASIDVLVTDPAGEPVSADVVVRGIDEKLFAMGAAAEDDALASLYRSVSSGRFGTYASHRVPRWSADDGKGTGGDGGSVRTDFRDQVLFRLVHTDADGRARVRFDLSDDLTSWHVRASAIDERLRAGDGTAMVPVGLPFFVDVVMASEVLAADRPGIRVRAYGTELREGDRVTFSVSAPTLGMSPTTVTVRAFEETTVRLPTLSVGRHPVTITGAVARDPSLRDGLERTLSVIPSRLTELRRTWTVMDGPVEPAHGPGWTGYLVTDAGRGAAIPVLLDLLSWGTTRADALIAAAEARRRLVDDLGVDPATLPSATLDSTQVQHPDGGISPVPYGAPELELSSLVALVAPDAVDRVRLRDDLAERRYQIEDTGSTGRLPVVLAGQAALGEDVAGDIRSLATEGTWTADQLVWLGLGAAAAGDDDLARTIEQALLERFGEQQVPFVRILGPDGRPDPVTTARVGLLAAWLGDLAVADACARFAEVERPGEASVVLERLGTAIQRADHLPAVAARFAVVIGGERTEVDLEPGASWFRALLPAQTAGLRLEPIHGSVSVATTSLQPLDPATVADDPAIRVTRRVAPSGALDATDLVTVRLHVTIDATALPGCYLVQEVAPSGLVPVRNWRSWRWKEGEQLPWSIEGQRVTWCVSRGDRQTTLRYQARVVGPGRYAWEPALVQSVSAPGARELAPEASTVVLR